MKKALVAIAALFVSLSAFAQGQVVFNTHDTSVAPPIDARVLNPDGTPATAGFGELVIVGAGGALTPLTTGAPAAFKTSANGAGYINAGAATAPIGAGFGNGSSVQIILRAWQGAAGSTFDTAAVKGQSTPITVVLREAPTPPDGLTGLSGFTMTPEPTTLALGALGLGALTLYRRRK
jgi:MYXO-CTERM domain-containing protein